MSAMSNKDKSEIETETLKAVKEEFSLNETVAKLRVQIGEQEKEMSDLRKLNKKLEKRNKNLKDSIDKLIEEKRQIEELSKIIDEQKAQIEDYANEVDDLKNSQKAAEEKSVAEKRSTPSQGNKFRNTDVQLISKQIELLSSKNQELKSELDRRTRISDLMKREHEAALRDRNELLTEVKSLKQQVDEMKHRLDRSLALLVRKRKGIKDTEESLSTNSSTPAQYDSLLNSTKATQTKREKTPTKITSTSNKRGVSGRLILNSVGRVNQKDSDKKSRIPRPLKSNQHSLSPSEQSSKFKEESNEVLKDKGSDIIELSESILQVKGKRVVSDIRSKLEKKKKEKEYPGSLDYSTTSTVTKSVAPAESVNDVGISDNVMDLFEVLDEDSSSPRKI